MPTEGKRSPTAHRTPAQMRKQVRGYNARPKQVKNRARNNSARATLAKEGKVHKGDGKDVHHKKPLRSGGSNARNNLAVASRAKNRGWNKGKKK